MPKKKFRMINLWLKAIEMKSVAKSYRNSEFFKILLVDSLSFAAWKGILLGGQHFLPLLRNYSYLYDQNPQKLHALKDCMVLIFLQAYTHAEFSMDPIIFHPCTMFLNRIRKCRSSSYVFFIDTHCRF